MAATAHHAPRMFATRFSALYFLTLAIGMSIAGNVSKFYDPTNHTSELRYFAVFGISIIVIGVGSLMVAKKVG